MTELWPFLEPVSSSSFSYPYCFQDRLKGQFEEKPPLGRTLNVRRRRGRVPDVFIQSPRLCSLQL